VAAVLLALAPASASAAPSVSLTGISSQAPVSGKVTLGADTSSGVTQVKWYVDGDEVGWDYGAPWQANWHSPSVADGRHTIFAKAADGAGAWGTSAVVTFTIANDAAVEVTSPAAGSTVSGAVTLSATASDPTGVRQMKWYVDGAEVGWDGSAPWQVSWSSAGVAAGKHMIFAKAQNGEGDWITSAARSFTVQSTQSTLVFEDDFDGTTLNTASWSPYNSAGHAGHGLRRPSAITVSNGKLVVTARMVDGKLVSGGMSNRLNRTYGRYEFRVRTDVDPTGTMSGVLLTWPKHQWSPQFTENDIYETGKATGTRWPFRTFIHYGTSGTTQRYFVHKADASQWHTMVMDWRPSSLKIYRDGELVWTVTDTAVIPDVLHHLAIQLDARATRTLTTAVRMYVDYVRIYR